MRCGMCGKEIKDVKRHWEKRHSKEIDYPEFVEVLETDGEFIYGDIDFISNREVHFAKCPFCGKVNKIAQNRRDVCKHLVFEWDAKFIFEEE